MTSPLKVLHISNEKTWRGGENQIRLLIEGLKEFAVESMVAFPPDSKGLEVLRKYAPTLELASRSAYDPRSVLRLIKFCRENKIQLLDAHSSGGMSLALAVKKRLPNLKLVVHRRTAFAIKNNFFSQKKYLNPMVDQYVCISQAIGEIVAQYGIKKDKISVVKSAIDEEVYKKYSPIEIRKKIRLKYNLSPTDVLIGCASALTGEKGHDTIIRACQILKNKKRVSRTTVNSSPNGSSQSGETLAFKCLFAGDGDLRDTLQGEVKRQGLEETIEFLGFTNEIYEFLCGLDILLLPSLSEGLGTILLEGAFAGCALIGSQVGGIPEVIVHNETGLLFHPNDEQELATAIEKLITQPQLRESLSNSLKNHVRKEFSLKKMVEGNQAVYKKLCGI